jgi:hypothetical protein
MDTFGNIIIKRNENEIAELSKRIKELEIQKQELIQQNRELKEAKYV